MPTEQIVALLIAERDKLNLAIQALQGPTKRRGRPPKNPLNIVVAPVSAPVPVKTKRRKFTAAQREAASERMRQRWAEKRKTEAKSQPKAAHKPRKTTKAA
jgi:hypothetical protein